MDSGRQPAWTDPTLGDTPGLGNDRAGGGVDLKDELDPGAAVVRFAYDSSRIDRDWSTLEARGFAWWGHQLRQRIWADPAIDDDGIAIHRVFARTDLVRRVGDHAAAGQALDALNGMSSGSALILDTETATVSSVTSMWVHEQSVGWVARAFAAVAAIQVAQAHGLASLLAPMVGGELDVSDHPTSGPRPTPDDMLSLVDVVRQVGAGPSLFEGDLQVQALREIQRIPMVTLATGDESGLALQLPYRQTDALVQMDTRQAHPSLGSGLLVRTSLPGDAGPGPVWAAMRNQQEITSLTRAQFLGSWVGSTKFATYVSFYPSFLVHAGLAPINLALSEMHRIRWLAELGTTV